MTLSCERGVTVPFDPASLSLQALFHNPSMFDSRDAFRAAGFEVFTRSSDRTIMVGSHASRPGVLFKKYSREIDLDEQLENYAQRVEGARRLRRFIDDEHLRRIVVPRKQLLELPRAFASRKHASHVLVVERLNVVSSDESERRYHRIDEEVLRELCAVLYAFRGLDSNAKNVTFTEEGRIAFVDTEHWDRHSGKRKNKKPYLRHIHQHLSKDRQELAEEIFDELEDEDD